MDALIREIEIVSRGEYPAVFDTVFFGGGTPSLLTGEQMERILYAVHSHFPVQEGAEQSMECNPGTATRKKLAAYRKAGINRLSIGLQSTHDALLKSVGRIHTYQQFLETLEQARSVGFDNINADVMHGLPGQTLEQYMDTLQMVCDLGLQHISSYALTLEEHTPLYEQVANELVQLPESDLVADMQDAGMDYLESRGYHRYEISNFALPGYECRHNLNYWRNGEYLGLGIAAHAVVRKKRWTRTANVDTLEEYLRLIARGRRPLAETIELHIADEMFECVMLGLRLIAGVDRTAFRARFGVDMTEAFADPMEQLRKRGWVEETETSIALNRKGLDLQNEALGFFL